MKLELSKLNPFRKNTQDSVMEIGKVILFEGKVAKIIKRVKTDLDPHPYLKYNTFRSFMAELQDGQIVYVQESDIACPIKKTKQTISHGN